MGLTKLDKYVINCYSTFKYIWKKYIFAESLIKKIKKEEHHYRRPKLE